MKDHNEEEGDVPSLRDTLSAAMEEPTEAPAPVADVVEPPAEAEAAPEKPEKVDGKARDEAGRFAKPKAEKVLKAVPPEVRKPLDAAAPIEAPKPVAPEVKAPQSWKPLVREKWTSLPPEVREEVVRREKEHAQALQDTAEDRKFAGSVREAFAPYMAQIQAEGSHPLQTIQNLLGTAQALRTAPPDRKAQLVAGIIQQFGVPLEGLVAHLQGQPMPQQRQAAPQVDPAAIERNVLERLQAQRMEAIQSKAKSQLESFLGEKEFADELREDMADILERAARRGSTLTLEQAYSRAAREHPEISKVFEQREAAERAAKASASTQRSRLAASSVRSNPSATPAGGKGQPTDLRSILEAAVGASGR